MNMPVHISGGMPTPAWINQVHDMMIEIGKEYPLATTERKRRLAGAAIAQLLAATRDLGVFQGEAAPAEDALLQMLMMIGDLEGGRRHAWALPISVGGTSGETQVDRELRLWAITGVILIKRAGRSPVAAYRAVAERLTAAGRAITDTGVKTWFTRHNRDPRPKDQDRISDRLKVLDSTGASSTVIADQYLADKDGLIRYIIERFQP